MNGNGPQPFEQYIGRLSEEFGGMRCSDVLDELERLPVGFMERVIEYRAYANTKVRYEASQKEYEPPLLTLVKVIEAELVQEEIDAGKEAERE